jgi:hypothetical protein
MFGSRFSPVSRYALELGEWCFEDKVILPTGEQGKSCIRVCQYLTNFYRPIELVRFDERTGIVYIFAGEELQVVIYRDGKWRFR